MRLDTATIFLILCLSFQAQPARADLAVGQALDIPGTPTIVVLDKQGRVVFYHVSEFFDAGKFLRDLRAHLHL